jgi:molybdopterin-binding protein
MKISARNQIPGTITAVTPGAVNATVKVDIGNGIVITSSITEEAIADLGLKAGDAVTVIVKASDVLIGKEAG